MYSKPEATNRTSQSKPTPGSSTNQDKSGRWSMLREAGEIYYVRRDGEMVKLPPSGPPNPIVRSGNLLPFSKDAESK
jgi:hypothetical protein